MAETYPTTGELAALSGTEDAEQEVLYVAAGEKPFYASFYKMLYRLLDVARRAGDLRVYKDGELAFGVRAGRYMDSLTPASYAGSAGNALVDDATNYIYLTADGTLTVNQTAFPDQAVTPHLPLATVTTADGEYALSDITDYRGLGMFALPTTELAAGAVTLAMLADDIIDGGKLLGSLIPSNAIIQIRRDTAAAIAGLTLAAGELAHETDTGVLRIGTVGGINTPVVLPQGVVSQSLTGNAQNITIDARQAAVHIIDLNNHSIGTVTVTNPMAGMTLKLVMVHDGTHNVAWPTAAYAGGACPTVTALTDGYMDIVTFIYGGTTWKEISRSLAVR